MIPAARLARLVVLFACLGLIGGADVRADSEEFFTGFEERFLKIEEDAHHAEPCDDEDYEIRLEVARALDEWSDRVRFADAWIRVGPLKLRKREAGAVKLEWEEEVYDWTGAYALWRKLRYASDADPRWERLRKRVVRLLNSDDRRRVDEVDLSLDRRHVAAGPEIYHLITNCSDAEIESSDCTELDEAAVTRFLHDGNVSFRGFYRDWKEAKTPAYRRRTFAELETFAKFLFDYELPRKTPGIRWNDDALEASMRAGDFAGYEKKLADVIEKFWNVAGNTLRIQWIGSDAGSAFVFRFLDRPGHPSSVNRAKRVIRLANESRESTPAHEFGHVLGFRDRYFKIWRPSRCDYVYQFLRGDLMGEVSAGRVLPEHWRVLRETY
jgi:hypothetical protein